MKLSIPTTMICVTALLLICSPASAESAFEFQKVVPGKILIEFESPLIIDEDQPLITGLADLDAVMGELDGRNLRRLIPNHRPELYILEFSPDNSVETAVMKFKEIVSVKDAFPCPLVEYDALTYHPDDMLYPGQWHHQAMESEKAWGIYRGSIDTQVGIIDGGVTYTHEDLAPNIWINAGEDLNGNGIIEESDVDSIDNDDNGYRDDFWGWDWIDLDSSQVWPGEDPGPPDNDPMDFDGHGTHCAGDACAASGNGIGVASPGFNCQIMSLRAGYLSTSGQGYVDLSAAIPAVYYAVDMGAEVLSMSFGGDSPYYPFSNALEYASNEGLILVGAAGNDSAPNIQYPAGYDFVIAVAATAEGDVLADFSNYGTWITLCAPGDAILSTLPDVYGNMGGTSMATPIVAGAAAMVKSLKPEWGYTDVSQWLAFTADNIDAQNPSYIGQLGGGRLNLANAVDLHVAIDSLWTDLSVDATRLQFNTQSELFIQYHMYLGEEQNVLIELSSDNPRITFGQNSYFVGNINTGYVGNNSDNPFLITVADAGEMFEMVEIDANISGAGFEYTQVLRVPVGRGQVLLLDADDNNELRTSFYYETNLEEMGYSFETWIMADDIDLSESLEMYDIVVMFSGTAETDIIAADHWNALYSYVLSDDGNLIVTGQNIADDCSINHPWVLPLMFDIEYLEPHSEDLTISGTPGNPVTEDMLLVMAGEGGAWNQYSMDVIEAGDQAESYFVYDIQEPDLCAGVKNDFYGSGTIFFLSFGIEGINDDAASGNTQLEVLQMMFDEFGVTNAEPFTQVDQSPGTLKLYPPYPNPFNNSVKIAYELGSQGPLTIKIFDLLGREVMQHRIESAPTGYGEWVWDAPVDLSSGIYFVSIKAEKKESSIKCIFLK